MVETVPYTDSIGSILLCKYSSGCWFVQPLQGAILAQLLHHHLRQYTGYPLRQLLLPILQERQKYNACHRRNQGQN